MKTEIKVLEAFYGDCILINTFDSSEQPFTILVDGGPSKTFKYTLRKELKDLQVIDLLVLTHIDADHISGLIRFLKGSEFSNIDVKRYWINGANLARVSTGEKISFAQGKTLEELLLQHEPSKKWEDQIYYTGDDITLSKGVRCKVLSPTKVILDKLHSNWPEVSKELISGPEEIQIARGVPSQVGRGSLEELAGQTFMPAKKIDTDLANGSSIAFLLNLPDASILLLGDSRAEVVEASLKTLGYSVDNPISTDYVKISHHGSKNNTSCGMLDLIDSEHFVISTNGGSGKSKHPDREILARILYHPGRNQDVERTIYFNYPVEVIQQKSGVLFGKEELETANCRVVDESPLILGPLKNNRKGIADGR
ncbi:MBL fold metallo-hydrolase [bacterium]|nr:MBL fold metallo-hydrolase [bacterium]